MYWDENNEVKKQRSDQNLERFYETWDNDRMDNYSINYLLKVDRFTSTDCKNVFSLNHLTLALSRTSFMTESLLIQEFLPDLHKSLILNWGSLVSKVKHMHIEYGYLPGFIFLFFFPQHF